MQLCRPPSPLARTSNLRQPRRDGWQARMPWLVDPAKTTPTCITSGSRRARGQPETSAGRQAVLSGPSAAACPYTCSVLGEAMSADASPFPFFHDAEPLIWGRDACLRHAGEPSFDDRQKPLVGKTLVSGHQGFVPMISGS